MNIRGTFQSKIGVFFIVLIFLFPLIMAHGGVAGELERTAWADPVLYIKITGIFLIVLTFFMVAMRKNTFLKKRKIKRFLFLIIIFPVALSSLYLGWNSVYENIISETKGPVHWHADFQVWDCGKEIALKNPEGLSNRIGSSTLHEHNDKRIHVEGTLLKKEEVDLGYFFQDAGGSFTSGILAMQTNDGTVQMKDGDLCRGEPGRLQVFVYKIMNAHPSQKNDFLYTQEKLSDPEHYILSPYGNVPPGDCIIIEFDQEKELTDKICNSYAIALQEGKMRMER